MPDPIKDTPSRIITEPTRINGALVYDKLQSGQAINIAPLGKVEIILDEENLGLESVTLENLQRGWERDKDSFTQRLVLAGIRLDPFTAYKYYQIQRKTLQVLGKPIASAGMRGERALGNNFRLSEAKGQALCSEYAILSTFIAQKIGEPARLVIGMTPIEEEHNQWREPHAYIWLDNINAVYDPVLAENPDDLPALMLPSQGVTFDTLLHGQDVSCKQIGKDFSRNYGLEPFGFGVRL